jgi:hypothetical protein
MVLASVDIWHGAFSSVTEPQINLFALNLENVLNETLLLQICTQRFPIQKNLKFGMGLANQPCHQDLLRDYISSS